MRSTRRAMGACLAVLGLLLSVLSILAPPAAADVGNNGTVKIGDAEFDGQGNEPHIPCESKITWAGFDDGQQTTKVDFEVQQPTLNTNPNATATKTTNGGFTVVANGPAVDHEELFNLSALLAPFEPHPKNGFHVKITVTTTASSGSDVKHKVFWIQPCEDEERDFGGLSVDKVVSGNDPQPANLEFGFSVACTFGEGVVDLDPEGAGTTAIFSLTAGAAPESFSSIPTGATCTVSETEARGADSTSWTVNGSADAAPIEVVIGDDTTVAVVATNVFNAERCVPNGENNQCCPQGQTPNGQGGCITPCTSNCGGGFVPTPQPDLSADLECSVGGFRLTVTNKGAGAGNVDVVRNGETVLDNLSIPANGSESRTVTVPEDTDYDIEVVGVDSFSGTRNCTEVEGVVVPNTPPAPPAPVAPPAKPAPTVKGVQVLPRTGSTTGPMAGLGLGLVLVGAGLMLVSRRQLLEA